MPSRPKAITKWNLLALLAVVAGGAVTLGLDQLWIRHWSMSGERFPIGHGLTIDLPARPNLLIYYESAGAVPTANVVLVMTDPYGRRVRPRRATDDTDNFKVLLGGWSGRALWELDIVEPGVHTFSTFNNNYESDAEVPPGDRIVFLKTPSTLAEVGRIRKLIQITGASVTMLVAIALYVLHALTLAEASARAARGPRGPSSSPAPAPENAA
jgi:hypothetical protein